LLTEELGRGSLKGKIMREEIKEAIEKGLEVLSWCQENADEKWMVAHLALVRTHINQALAKLKEEKGDVFEICIPNLKPDEVQIVQVEIKAFTKQLLNNLQARRRVN